MQHPEQRISAEAQSLLSEIGKSPNPILDPVTFDAIAAEIWRGGGAALPGTPVTWKLVRNTTSHVASSLALVCTDPAVIAQIAHREKRRSVLDSLLDNAHFPADTAQELLRDEKFHNSDSYERMLCHTKLYDRQVPRFVNGVAASKSMTVESVTVGLRTSDLFCAEIRRRLTGGDTDLMILVYETLSRATGRPSPALSSELHRALRAAIPSENVPFGLKLVKYLLSDLSHVQFGRFVLIPQIDANSIRYLQSQDVVEHPHTDGSQPGSSHIKLCQALQARCRDAELAKHDALSKNWYGGQETLVELLFSSDASLRETALWTCLQPKEEHFSDHVSSYMSRIGAYLLRGELRGWAGINAAALTGMKLSFPFGEYPKIDDQITDAVLAQPGDLDEVFEHLMNSDPSTAYAEHPGVSQPNGEILTLIPIILRSIGDRLTNEQFVSLVNRYCKGAGFERELYAAISTMKDRGGNLKVQALLLKDGTDVLDAWFDGRLWGVPTVQDASNVIDELSKRDRTGRTVSDIARALLLGGMSSDPSRTLGAIKDDPQVTREFLRRYEKAEGFDACALLVATTTTKDMGNYLHGTTPEPRLTDWLEAQPRTVADLAALTAVLCMNAAISKSQGAQLIAASGEDLSVLEPLVRSAVPHLSKVALDTQKLPTSLAVTALSQCGDEVFVNWVAGTQHGPALTEHNIAAVLTETALREPETQSSTHSIAARRVVLAGNELVAHGFGSILDTYDGVPRELLNLTYELKRYSSRFPPQSGRCCEYGLEAMAGLLNLAGEPLVRYLLETVATWEGSFDDLRALILAVRPD
jgi:hypothetical protein